MEIDGLQAHKASWRELVEPLFLDEDSWKVIGSGGYGQVFKARHLQWRWDVAIKILFSDDG